VTIPHKEHALRWLVGQGFRTSELARRCGAVNTLVRRADGTWEGDNTDARGALAALQSSERIRDHGLRGRQADVLGAGGVARAIAAALCAQGCTVIVYNRTPQRAENLARELRCSWKPWDERRQYTGDILINCTSVGLWPAVDDSPLPDEAVRPGTLVMDTVYRPAQTRLLRAAAARGCETISGAEMFLAQAAVQHELWHGVQTGTASTLDVMRAALQPSLGLSDPGARAEPGAGLSGPAPAERRPQRDA
jgi:3-dehydroquinate dehydratase/shikimate dehydrogenase